MKHLILIVTAIALVINQSCTMVKISVSEKRNKNPQVIEISNDLKLTTWGTIKVNKSHFFPSSFLLNNGNELIYIDPVEINSKEKADYILITHSHPDHFSLKDIKKIIKPTTKIICSRGVFNKLKGIENNIQVVKPDDSLIFERFKLDAIAAYNTNPVFLWIKAHSKSKENVGFVLTFDNGIRVYHAGDTDYIPEMNKISNINVALIPIGGDNLTMNINEAASIVNIIKPEIVVPIHYEIDNNDGKPEEFRKLINENTRVLILE